MFSQAEISSACAIKQQAVVQRGAAVVGPMWASTNTSLV